jgi:hypothetical protein
MKVKFLKKVRKRFDWYHTTIGIQILDRENDDTEYFLLMGSSRIFRHWRVISFFVNRIFLFGATSLSDRRAKKLRARESRREFYSKKRIHVK